MSLPAHCDHGVGFAPDDECIFCEVIWASSRIRDHLDSLKKWKSKLSKLKDKINEHQHHNNHNFIAGFGIGKSECACRTAKQAVSELAGKLNRYGI